MATVLAIKSHKMANIRSGDILEVQETGIYFERLCVRVKGVWFPRDWFAPDCALWMWAV